MKDAHHPRPTEDDMHYLALNSFLSSLIASRLLLHNLIIQADKIMFV